MNPNQEVKLCRTFYSTGEISQEIYLDKHDIFHREDGPANIYWSTGGIKTREVYYRHGKKHREDGPALVHYCNLTGHVEREYYFVNNKLHRVDGPAFVWHVVGVGILERYYINDKKYNKEEFDAFFKGADTKEDRESLVELKTDFN